MPQDFLAFVEQTFPARRRAHTITSLGRAKVPRQQIHRRHAHGDAHLDLLLYDRAIDVVGESSVNLDPAVHRAGVHDDGVGFGAGELFGIQPEAVVIFAFGRDEAAVHPLFLQRSIITTSQPAAPRACRRRPRRPSRRPGGHQRRRADRRMRLSILPSSRMFERATREWAMSPQIATFRRCSRPLARRIVNASNSAWVGCSWRPSPAFRTAQVHLFGQQVHAPGMRMPHHQKIGVHGVQRQRGVDQRFALFHRRDLHRHRHDIGAQALARDLERAWVRVEASKNMLIWVRPASTSVCLRSRRLRSTYWSERSRSA